MVKANETREDEGAHSEFELGVGVQVALENGRAMQWTWHHDGSVGFVKRHLYHMRYIPAGAVGGARWQMTVQVTSYNRWKDGRGACRYMGSRRRPEMKDLSTPFIQQSSESGDARQ